jgi:hypothetical protein
VQRYDDDDAVPNSYHTRLPARFSLAHATPQVWTSMKDLDGREFCFMLNALIRDDAKLTDEVADQVPTRDEPR